MHELILDLMQDQPGSALARFPLDDGALLCLFRGGACPRWVAKTASGDAGIHRLRAEAVALNHLDPWAAVLGVPRRLGWHDGAATGDGVACLVQTGVTGAPAAGACDWRHPWAKLPVETRRIATWLRQFQTTVPPPRNVTFAELEREARSQAESACRHHPTFAALLVPALTALPHLPEPQRTGTAIHGDFWAGNVLLESRYSTAAPHVIDWSGFGAGTELEDLLTWIAHLGAGRRSGSRLERWRALFFTPGTMRDFLLDWSRRCGYGENLARWAFYLFLLRRMGWELGLGLQARDAVERALAQREWPEIASWLAQHRYPDPFTPLPV